MAALYPKHSGNPNLCSKHIKQFYHLTLLQIFAIFMVCSGQLSAQCELDGPDLDNDGVADVIDLDNDNDGILNSIEYGCDDTNSIFNWDTAEDPAGSKNFTWNNVNDEGLDMTLVSTYPTSVGDVGTPETMSGILVMGMDVSDISDPSQFTTFDITFSEPTDVSSFIIQDIDNETRFTFTSYSDRVSLEFLDINGNVLPQMVTLGSALSLGSDGYVTAPGQLEPVEFGEMENWATYSTTGLVSTIRITYYPNDGGGVSNPGEQFIALGNISFCTPRDTDGDGVPDFEDLDSDNDGIPDAIEACGDISLTLEDCSLDSNGDTTYTDFNGNGCSDGLVSFYCSDAPIDTDGDGTPDYLDLDSDDDGCTDNIEALTNTFGTSGEAYVVGNVDTYGLLLTGISGTCPIPNTVAYIDSDNNSICVPIDPCELNDRADKDNDGVSDDVDIDTDNDGIPDAIENSCSTETTLFNWGLVEDPMGSLDYTWTNVDDMNLDMTLVSSYGASVGNIDTPETMSGFLVLGMDVADINDPNQIAIYELSFSEPVNITAFDIQDIDNETRFTFTSYSDRVFVEFLDVNGNTVPSNVNLGSALSIDDNGFVTAPGQLEPVEFGEMENWATYSTTGLSSSIRVYYYPNNGGGVSNPGDQFIALGDIIFCPQTDTDGDGVPDYEDLDSDNDGIPDAIEACGQFDLVLEDCSLDSNGDAEYPDFNGDGCPDGLVASYCADAPADTDDDGIPDYLDLDSDGDGCSDNFEAGTAEYQTSTDTYIAGNVDECGRLLTGISTDCPSITSSAWIDASTMGACGADLDLTKTVSNANPMVGDVITYTIAITNSSANTATGVSVEDIIPSGLNNISTISNEGLFVNNVILWSGLTIPEFSFIELTYQATVRPPLSGINYENVAQITASDQFDNDSTPNNDDGDQSEDDENNAVISVVSIDLELVKSANIVALNVGDQVTYTIEVSNNGLDNATNVAVQDMIPSGLSDISNIDNGGSLTSGIISWNGLSIASGGAVTLTYTAIVQAPSSGGSYENIAQVTEADQYDIDSTPNNDDGDQSEDDEDSEVIVVNVVDLSLDKSVSDSNPNVGDVITYTIIVSNQGLFNATNVSVEDIIPTGLSNVTNISNGGVIESGVIEWTGLNISGISGTNSLTLTYQATVEAPLAGISYQNIAQVTAADQYDPDSTPNNDDGDQSEDDEDSDVITVPVVDLELTKSVSNTSPNIGDVLTYSLTVSNVGIDYATGVEVEDILPTGVTNITNISGSGTLSGNVITWPGLSIQAGSSISLTYDVTVVAPSDGISYTNIAQVTAADQFDIDSTPNNDDGDQSEDDEDNLNINVVSTIDIELSKTVSNANPHPGDVITYSIIVTNTGLNTATGVAIQDIIPNGLTNIANISENGTISESVITWSDLTLSSGNSIILTYQATVVVPSTGIIYTNIAQVTASDQMDIDSTPNNDDGDQSEDDEDSDMITVPIVDLELTKSVSNTSPNIGDVLTYSLTVRNVGLDNATGVEVKDILPTGLTNITNISGSGTLSANVITWLGLSIQAGSSTTLTYDVTVVAPSDGVSYSNIAQVTATDQFDIDSTPNNDDGDQSEDDEDNATIIIQVVCDAEGPDKDNDGAPDTTDLDIDNDGIPNVLEGVCIGGPSGVLDWSTLENPNESIDFNWTNVLDAFDLSLTSSYPEGTANVMNPEIVEDYLVLGMNVSDINDPSQFTVYELEFSVPTVISSITVHDIDNETRFNVTNYSDEVLLEFLDVNGNLLSQKVDIGSALVIDGNGLVSAPNQVEPIAFSESNNWATYSTTELVSTIRISYFPNNGGGVTDPGNQFIALKQLTLCEDLDTDGDGVPDYIDLDSDNDGIPDAVEACGNNNLVLEECSLDNNGDEIYIDSDGDGCHDGLVASYCTDAPIDTDMDGTPDFQDLDSDNDGCVDSVEAGSTFLGASEDVYITEPVDLCGLLIALTGSGTTIGVGTGSGSGHHGYGYYDHTVSTGSGTDTGSGTGDSIVVGVGSCVIPVSTSWIDEDNHSECDDEPACIPIGDFVWFDGDMDNIWDHVAQGINGIKVLVYQLQDDGTYDLYDLLITDEKPGNVSNDGYWKTCVPPGSYYVQYEVPGGLIAVMPNMGNNESVDSDVTHANGNNTTDTFTLVNGNIDHCDIGAGFNTMATVGDRVWFDENANGMLDNDEEGIAGVQVKVYDMDDELVSSTRSNASGRYIVENLQVRDYYLQFVPPADYTPTIANNADEAMDSDIDFSHGFNTTSAFRTIPGEHKPNMDGGFIRSSILASNLWLGISADRVSDQNQISWVVSSDEGIDHYSVQKLEANKIIEIGQKIPTGSTDKATYQLTDQNSSESGDYFYRVVAISTDGLENMSDVIDIKVLESKNQLLSVFPNPASDKISIELANAKPNNHAVLSIKDVSGRYYVSSEILSDNIPVGNVSFSYDVSALPSGMYTMEIVLDDSTLTKKLMIIE